MVLNQKKDLVGKIIISLIFVLYLVLATFLAYSQDAKTQFIEAIKKQQALMPKTFNCKISSVVFFDFFKQLPSDAFIKTINDISIILIAENGIISIKIDGIKQDYMDFALSYFNIYTELLTYVFLSSEELTKQIDNYTIKIEKNVFILKDNTDLTSYNFIFTNNLLSTVVFYQDNIKKMEINITYFAYKNYQLVKLINIVNYDENGNKKENMVINFSNYKF